MYFAILNYCMSILQYDMLICCDAADCDRCDLLQLIRNYSSCATRSARLRLCRLHVSVSANDQLQLIQS